MQIKGWLPLSAVESAAKEAKSQGVSTRARSRGQFLDQYRRAQGDPKRLPDAWRRKRNAFVARHMAQVRKQDESLWDASGRPSRRHLALAVWAYSPDPTRLGDAMSLRSRRNPAKGVRDLPPGVFIDRCDQAGQRVFTFVDATGTATRRPMGFITTVAVDAKGRKSARRAPHAHMVVSVSATQGWGPFLYDLAMESATADGVGLIADRREVSARALPIWDNYAGRGDVTRFPIDAGTPRVFDYATERYVGLLDTRSTGYLYKKHAGTTTQAVTKAARWAPKKEDAMSPRRNTRRRNTQDLGDRSQRVIDHLVSRCGMSRKEAIEAVGKQTGEGSDRPALTPEGLALYERTVDKMDFRVPPYKTIFKLLPRTGMRIGEMVTMTWDRLDRGRGVWLVVGKNSDLREIPVTKDSWALLDAYEREYNPKSKGDGHWVFPRMRGPDHISVSRAGGAMRALRMEEPRLSDLTPHVLRHTFATQKLRECASPSEVRKLMGHRGQATAMLYYHL